MNKALLAHDRSRLSESAPALSPTCRPNLRHGRIYVPRTQASSLASRHDHWRASPPKALPLAAEARASNTTPQPAVSDPLSLS